MNPGHAGHPGAARPPAADNGATPSRTPAAHRLPDPSALRITAKQQQGPLARPGSRACH